MVQVHPHGHTGVAKMVRGGWGEGEEELPEDTDQVKLCPSLLLQEACQCGQHLSDEVSRAQVMGRDKLVCGNSHASWTQWVR